MPKNVILLTIDALRKDVLGCYGGNAGLTPFIDSIQDHSIRFNNAHSSGPYTKASFPGILTSSYYLEYAEEEKLQDSLSTKRILVSEVLQYQGIATGGFHSNVYLWDCYGWNKGWDIFYDSSEENVDDVIPYAKASSLNLKAANWLGSLKAGGSNTPFFLWLHYMDIHEPYTPEMKYVEAVDPSINITVNEMMDLFNNVLLKRDISDRNKVELLKKLYMANVIGVDEAVKDFFYIIRELNFLENSVIIITSDHGEEFGEHGGLSHDGKMYSELVGVPLIIYDPSLKKGEDCDSVVSLIDVSPTIIYLFGLDDMRSFEGNSLLPLERPKAKGIFGESFDKHGSDEIGNEKEIHFYREENMKVIFQERCDSWKVFDLKEDPKEQNNIFDTFPRKDALIKKMKSRIRRHASGGNSKS